MAIPVSSRSVLNRTGFSSRVLLTEWDYPVGTELVDDTMQALGDYYGCLLAWYTRGGFIDQYGPVEFYTRAYDAVVQGIRRHTSNYDMKYV